MPEEPHMVMMSLQELNLTRGGMAAESGSAGWPRSQAALKNAAFIRMVLHSVCPQGGCRLCFLSSLGIIAKACGTWMQPHSD